MSIHVHASSWELCWNVARQARLVFRFGDASSLARAAVPLGLDSSNGGAVRSRQVPRGRCADGTKSGTPRFREARWSGRAGFLFFDLSAFRTPWDLLSCPHEMVPCCPLRSLDGCAHARGCEGINPWLTVPLGAFAAWTYLCTMALWHLTSFHIAVWRAKLLQPNSRWDPTKPLRARKMFWRLERLERFCRISTLKSSNVPIESADLWCCPKAGSLSAPLRGSIAAEGLPRIGRISTEKLWRSCASHQSASCSENYAIQPEVSGRTLRNRTVWRDFFLLSMFVCCSAPL
jgi:hypothetical protein